MSTGLVSKGVRRGIITLGVKTVNTTTQYALLYPSNTFIDLLELALACKAERK